VKILIQFILLFSITLQAQTPDCRLLYTNMLEKHKLITKLQDKSTDLFFENFSPAKFVQNNTQIKNYSTFLDDLAQISTSDPLLFHNSRDLVVYLNKKKIIDGNSYQIFMNKINHAQLNFSSFENIYRHTNLNHLNTANLKKNLAKLKLNKEETEIIVNFLNTKKLSNLELDTLENYLSYVQTLPKDKTKNAIQSLHEIYLPKAESSHVRNFIKAENEIANYEKNLLASYEKKFKKKLSESETRRGRIHAKEKASDFRKLKNSCKNRNEVDQNAVATEKKFTRYLVGVSAASTAGGYWFANKDEEKDAKWWGNLSYEVAFGTFFTWLSSRVSIKHNWGFMKKTLVSFGVSSGFDVGDAAIYGLLFNEDGEKIKEELENDPEKKEEIEKLIQYFEENNLDDKFMQKYSEYYELQQQPNIEKIDINNEDDYIYDNIIQYINGKVDLSTLPDWADPNSDSVKRFNFHRAWDLISVPKTVLLQMKLYQIFCMSSVNPKKAYVLATTLIMADEIFEGFVYFKVRKETTGM